MHMQIELPEEAAFPVIAWLLEQYDDAAAIKLLDTLTPHMATMRFAPAPAPPSEAPLATECTPTSQCIIETMPLRRFTARHTSQTLKGLRVPVEFCKHHEAVNVWAPFYDDVLSLWLEVITESGELADNPLPEEWCTRAVLLVAQYNVSEAQNRFCQKHRRHKDNRAVLRTALAQAFTLNGMLGAGTRRQVSCRVQCMLQKRGRPGGPRMRALRESQAACVRMPLHTHLAAILFNRIESLQLSEDRGIPREMLEGLLQPVTATEAAEAIAQNHWNVSEGAPIPKRLIFVLRRAMEAPLIDLIHCGVLPSSEVIAEVVPKLAAAGIAAQYADPVLARLMAGLDAAFSANRRSVLLLKLQSQVRMSELPWHAAVRQHAEHGRAAGATWDLMRRLAEAALHAFPEAILPNRLVQQLYSLALLSMPREKAAVIGDAVGAHTQLQEISGGGDVGSIASSNFAEGFVLLEELAVDVFECEFTAKYAIAARHAARMLQGTVYERYYGLDYSAVLKKVPYPTFKGPSVEFYDLCEELCGLKPETGRGRVLGGRGGRGRGRGRGGMHMRRSVGQQQKLMLIEQAQIVTTHNLAMLRCAGVNGGVGGAGSWGALAKCCAKKVVTLTGVARRAKKRQVRLRCAKQAVYAWRQMVFFLSLEQDKELQAEAVEQLKQGGAEVKWVLQPKLGRLEAAFLKDGQLSEVEYGKPLVGTHSLAGSHRLLRPYE